MKKLKLFLALCFKPPQSYSRRLRIAHFAAILTPFITLPMPIAVKMIGIFLVQLPACYILVQNANRQL